MAISNKMLFHSLRLNCHIRAVPSRLPLTNLTKGGKSYSEIKGRSVQKRHLKIKIPEFRSQKQKVWVRSPNNVRMLYKWFEVKHTSHSSKKIEGLQKVKPASLSWALSKVTIPWPLGHFAELWHCTGTGTPQPNEHYKGLTLSHQVKRRALPAEAQTWFKTKPIPNRLAL